MNANYSVSYGTFTTTTINVNFTDVTMLNATYDSSKTLVVFSEPNYLNFTLYGINVYASMNTTSATGSTV